eukprot:3310830-Rhodomonas_salina.1
MEQKGSGSPSRANSRARAMEMAEEPNLNNMTFGQITSHLKSKQNDLQMYKTMLQIKDEALTNLNEQHRFLQSQMRVQKNELQTVKHNYTKDIEKL